MTAISTALPTPFISDVATVEGWQVQLGGQATRDPMVLMGRGTGYHLTAIDGFGVPKMQTSDVAYPFADGIAALGDFHGERDVALEGLINPVGFCVGRQTKSEQTWALMQALNGAWQARQFNTLLRFRFVTGQTYVLTGRPRDCAIGQSALWRGQVTFACRFIATEPRLFAPNMEARYSSLSDVTGIVGLCLDPVGAATCVTPDLCFGGLPKNGTVTASVQGNTTTPAIIEISGPTVGDSVVENTTTGETFTIAGAIANGDVVTVDTGLRTVTLGGTNRFNLLRPGSSLFWLIPGDNVVRLRTSDNLTGALRVRYRNAWI